MFNFGKKSRFDAYDSEILPHRKYFFKSLITSKKYEDFLKYTLPNMEYKVAVLPSGMEGRPDLLSQAVYGTVNYWWLLCEANSIIDPFEDLVAGMQLKIPTI